MKSRADAQLNLPPAEVRKSERDLPGFRNSEERNEAFRKAESEDGYAVSAELFDAAMIGSRLTNQEVAYLLKVSESLVQKWRKPDAHACPSFAQLLRLPPSFHIALHRAMNRRFGFGRAALVQLLESAGVLALAVE